MIRWISVEVLFNQIQRCIIIQVIVTVRYIIRNIIKRQLTSTTTKQANIKTLVLGDDSEEHIYETLKFHSPVTNKTVARTSISDAQELPPKSAYLLPTSLISFDHFTTNLYLVVNTSLNQILVVFGSTKIHTIKVYDTDGKKAKNDLILNYKYEDLHGYRVLSYALNNSNKYRIVVNEIRVYAKSLPLPSKVVTDEFEQTMKQRLLYFDNTGGYVSATKRLPVQNEISCVEIDRHTTSIYVYDGESLMCLDREWRVSLEDVECIACGRTFLVCLHMKNNQISVYNTTTGQFNYRWLISSSSVINLQAVHLCVSRNDEIYILAWNYDVSPPNNFILVFNEEGHFQREIYIPNRMTLNSHGKFEYSMTIGNEQQTPQNQISMLWKLQHMKQKLHVPHLPLASSDSSSLWMQEPSQLVWGTPSQFPFASYRNAWAYQEPSLNHSHLTQEELGFNGRQMLMNLSESEYNDPTIFRACFIAITDDRTLIVSNISDLDLDEDISQVSEIRLNRKIIFFRL
ncbi:unnamed protein product [Didymodactylos carnosus]|uniref:Uncharacterized protein n=1 Tax=Didymodactylos carnosus TaxID=1234261 RepID=A0A814FBK5_9BILA|nr:unnamed protein product [Didymodactylos carnosus]CAF1082151.1 unnamed protein product [Didymodactylos carnosus]CAF3750584.1 unnamed protein product [Didymodactylos carnosus]CAF3844988.1 unnamed protein product [Didymodactylos carnosus]